MNNNELVEQQMDLRQEEKYNKWKGNKNGLMKDTLFQGVGFSEKAIKKTMGNSGLQELLLNNTLPLVTVVKDAQKKLIENLKARTFETADKVTKDIDAVSSGIEEVRVEE